jgi:hypothetical protein
VPHEPGQVAKPENASVYLSCGVYISPAVNPTVAIIRRTLNADRTSDVFIRFLLSKKYHVNLRTDFAWGKDNFTWSMGVGEAF